MGLARLRFAAACATASLHVKRSSSTAQQVPQRPDVHGPTQGQPQDRKDTCHLGKIISETNRSALQPPSGNDSSSSTQTWEPCQTDGQHRSGLSSSKREKNCLTPVRLNLRGAPADPAAAVTYRASRVHYFLGGGGQAMISCRSLLIRRHSRNLSESRIRAIQCYDCPTRQCGSGHHT